MATMLAWGDLLAGGSRDGLVASRHRATWLVRRAAESSQHSPGGPGSGGVDPAQAGLLPGWLTTERAGSAPDGAAAELSTVVAALEAQASASTHQARPGRRRARRARRRRHRHRQRQVARLQPPRPDALAAEPKVRALYLYPTKALAQDQARALAALPPPAAPRRHLRRRHGGRAPLADPQVGERVLTNPDMLHVGVLPHHDRWGDVLQNLRYVVVDEAHVYRGVFGSHVANVLRRLRRAARDLRRRAAVPARLGDDREPGRAGRALLGVDATVIDDDAAPRAARSVVLWNPPLLDEALSSARARSAKRRACSPTSSPGGCARSSSPRAARRRS